MIKGNTNYRVYVTGIKESLLFLLSIIPQKLQEIESEINEQTNAQMEEWKEIGVERNFNYDLPYLDYADICFYGSIVQQIYSFAEIGLKMLTKQKGKIPKGIRNIDFYYNNIKKFYQIELKPIGEIWKHYDEFHRIRVGFTHKEIQHNDFEEKKKTNFLKKM